ncbi:hypothetical protein JVT61DRAFT_1102 [Boletus reticuloceps]|uniref:Histone H1 n=1 Tax=Boletus reticuloceps TaxID=495285 RepID=A0A8I2YU56_9AGAM|nr:hypothetical protein JVT61DRAFT_1102 [Boletus reticuloceps]
MQSASPTFPSPPAQNGYQPLSGGHSYIPVRSNIRLTREKNITEAEIYAIKRQYLGLLLPQQVIDIFRYGHMTSVPLLPPYRPRKPKRPQAQTSTESDASSKNSAPDVDSSSGEQTTRLQTSSSHQSTPATAQAGPSAGASSGSHPASQSAISPTTSGPHYPQHPYYLPGYPHTPYYTSPHATYGYPHACASYPQPPPMYPVNPASHHPPLFTNTPLVHPPHPAPEPPPPLSSVDDLPSYEEMIVEALLDSGDPEGCAPKSLFSWMAMHYPLQMNFRPSASQALQKAYRRGRLEKGSNGKYRLNDNWEGGNTSRRTTRRPQTLAQTTLPGPQPTSSSPFTHAPLVPHGARLPPPGQPPGYGGYPFGYPFQGTSGAAHAPSARSSSGTASQKQTADTIDHEAGEGSDAWEAAQNILKAINFGQLFQISNEENKAAEPSMSGGPHSQQATADGRDKPSLALGATIVEESADARVDGVGNAAELDAEHRAALQAQLALLAAQLAELADVSEGELSHNLEIAQRTTSMSESYTPQVLGEGSGPGDDIDDGHNEDMVEVTVPMASLTA